MPALAHQSDSRRTVSGCDSKSRRSYQFQGICLKIGINCAGQRIALRIARIVAAKMAAPPSFRSSRATDVTTACFSPIFSTVSATRSGSCQSNSVGRPVLTAQNRQARVQISPKIMKVAVRLTPQHS